MNLVEIQTAVSRKRTQAELAIRSALNAACDNCWPTRSAATWPGSGCWSPSICGWEPGTCCAAGRGSRRERVEPRLGPATGSRGGGLHQRDSRRTNVALSAVDSNWPMACLSSPPIRPSTTCSTNTRSPKPCGCKSPWAESVVPREIFRAKLVAIDPHRTRSYSKRHMRERVEDPGAKPAKMAQTFWALDADTHQPVCFTTATTARSVVDCHARTDRLGREHLAVRPRANACRRRLRALLERIDRRHSPTHRLRSARSYSQSTCPSATIPGNSSKINSRAVGLVSLRRNYPTKSSPAKRAAIGNSSSDYGECPDAWKYKGFLCTSDREEVDRADSRLPQTMACRRVLQRQPGTWMETRRHAESKHPLWADDHGPDCPSSYPSTPQATGKSLRLLGREPFGERPLLRVGRRRSSHARYHHRYLLQCAKRRANPKPLPRLPRKTCGRERPTRNPMALQLQAGLPVSLTCRSRVQSTTPRKSLAEPVV